MKSMYDDLQRRGICDRETLFTSYFVLRTSWFLKKTEGRKINI